MKVKWEREQDAVIGGYTEPRGGRKYFGSLVLGAYHNDELHFIGQCGGGFSDQSLKKLHQKLESLTKDESPL